MRHGERRVQVGGRLVVLHSADLVACMLPAERYQVMGAGIQFIQIQDMPADFLCFWQLASVGEEYGDQQLRIRIGPRLRWERAKKLHGFGEFFSAQQFDRHCPIPCRWP